MSIVNLDAILGSARNVVKSAKEEGRFYHITARIVRQQVERTFSLPKGFLDSKQYKSQIKSVVDKTIEEIDHSEAEESAGSVQKRTNIMSKKRKPDEHSNTEFDLTKKIKVDEDNSGSKKSLTAKRRQQEFKSKEFINSSDDEDGVLITSADPKQRKVSNLILPSASSSGPSTVAVKNAIKGGIHEFPTKEFALSSESTKITKKNKLKSTSAQIKSEHVSKESKAKEKAETTQTSKSKHINQEKGGRRKNAKELSPDEETIKRLKALVFACGIRKNWKKELQDLETPMRQIAHIKSVLRDLGMSGRMSMEQAKAIKAKREFEQEMKDVMEFAGKHSSTGAVRSESGNTSEDDSDDNFESDSDAEAGGPRKRRQKLSNVDSLQAFLANQSDDE